MATVDKNQAVINFLEGCTQIRNNRLFFNFINGENNDKQFITTSNDRNVQRPFIDGSVMKRYTFTIIDFRSVTYQSIVRDQTTSGTTFPNENVEEMLDVQGILDWVNEQADMGNYPDFGEDCFIDNMQTTSDIPNLNGVDTNVKPALAKYSISIHIDYIDNSKKLWR